MIMRCQHQLRDRIFNYTKNLRYVKNEDGDVLYVHKQLPEPLLTEKRECDSIIKEANKRNAQLPEDVSNPHSINNSNNRE